MAAVITCDFCNKILEIGYSTPTMQGFNVDISKANSNVILTFCLDISYKCMFTTTNVHWCRECLLKATKNKIEGILAAKEG